MTPGASRLIVLSALLLVSSSLNIASMIASDSFLIRWAEAGEVDLDRLIEYLDTSNYYHQTSITKQIAPIDKHDS